MEWQNTRMQTGAKTGKTRDPNNTAKPPIPPPLTETQRAHQSEAAKKGQETRKKKAAAQEFTATANMEASMSGLGSAAMNMSAMDGPHIPSTGETVGEYHTCVEAQRAYTLQLKNDFLRQEHELFKIGFVGDPQRKGAKSATPKGDAHLEPNKGCVLAFQSVSSMIHGASSFQNKWKQIAQKDVPHIYRFHGLPPTDTATIVEATLHHQSYKFEDFEDYSDAGICLGALRHPSIKDIVAQFFKAKDTRIVAATIILVFVAQLPKALAMILTVIHNVLDSWKSGSYDIVNLSYVLYIKTYLQHIKWINQWKAKCTMEWNKIQLELEMVAKSSSGVKSEEEDFVLLDTD
ncbi:hypothetical protein BS47DRAFT_1397963 [Hydnum rufescens UP504]|uniref:DUF6532 domain-containing protein n=1 Tax=Hydnum rufescens UP504 TaxID=1448309 RepID=A0A9P6DR80_9AGAM|nr:hypothetical protein BS47DRAFT_1397963 [Hydnum rufescens UP504]